jgi:hypothetical protein
VAPQRAQQQLAGATARVENARVRGQRQSRDGAVNGGFRQRVGKRQADVGGL